MRYLDTALRGRFKLLQISMKRLSTLLLVFFSMHALASEIDFKRIATTAKTYNCELNITTENKNYFLRTPEYMIFWCKKNDEYGFYDLLAINLGSDKWEPCGSYIPVQSISKLPIWVENEPKPYGENIYLNEFWYVSASGEKNKLTPNSKKSIVTVGTFSYGYFDLGQILYCHNGKWSMYGYH